MNKYFFLTILLIAIFLPMTAEAATEFVSSIQQSGGDYSTLASWEAAVQSDLTATTTRVFTGTGTGKLSVGDTVTCVSGTTHNGITARVVATTTTQILLDNATSSEAVVLEADDTWENGSNVWTVSGTGDELGDTAIATAKIDGAWSSADTTVVEITGWTTSATNYIKVYTTTAARHNGKWDTGGYRIEKATDVITISESNVRIEGLQIDGIGTTGYQEGIGIGGGYDNIEISHNIIRFSGNTDSGNAIDIGLGASVSNIKIWNNIIYDWLGSGINMQQIADGGAFIYNNTIFNCTCGMNQSTYNDIVAKNNICSNNTNADYCTSGAADSGYNANCTNNLSSDTTAPDSNPVKSATVSFVSELTDDFHLAGNDANARNAGTDLSGDANLAFSDDVDGETRGYRGWDIGADETFASVMVDAPLTNKLTDGLVGHWTFNGGDMDWASTTAEALDRSGNSNNGNVVNFGQEAVTGGISGQALEFDGVDDYVDCGSDEPLDNLADYTFAAWIKINDTVDEYGRVFSKGSINVRMEIRSLPEPYYFFVTRVFNGTNARAYTSPVLYDDIWYHVAATFSSTTYKTYLNGVEDTNGVLVGTDGMKDDSGDPVRMGTTNTGTYPFGGSIDEARFYDRVLSADEIEELYQAGARRLQVNAPLVQKQTGGLVGHWTFNGQDMDWASTTAEALDRSGNSNNGNVVNFGQEAVTGGISGQALEFDGVDDYVGIPAIITGTPFSVCAWVKSNSDTTGQTIFSIGDTGTDTNVYHLSLRGDQTGDYAWAEVRDTGNTWVHAETTKAYTVNTWHHVCGIFTSSTLRAVYIDGGNEGTETTSRTPIGIDSGAIGRIERLIPALHFNGTIDEVRVYDRALSADEVGELYRAGARRFKLK